MRYELNANDIYGFAAAVGAATQQKGNELTFRFCPYCQGGSNKDKDTFSVNLTTGAFNCLRSSCGKQGHFVELARDFNYDLGITAEKKQYRRLPQKEISANEHAVKYMQSRGISKEVTERYKITTQKKHDNILVFPFYDENNTLVAAKYRRTDFIKGVHSNKEWYEKDTKPILFGMAQCEDFKTLVITEGQIDSLSLAECGIKNAVSVPTGARGFTWLSNCWNWITMFEEIIVFGDFENGHMSVVDELRKRLRTKIRQVRAEDYLGEKDANDILRRYGKEAVKTAVKNAYIPPLDNVKSLSEVKSIDINTLPKISTGINEIDKIIGGLIFGQVILLSGKRGEGKSTFMSQLVVEAIEQEYPVFIYSGELADYHFKRWLDFQAAGSDNIITSKNRFNEDVYSISDDTVKKINRWYEGKAFIYDNNYVDTEETETLIETIEKAVCQYDIRLVCVDNLMTALDLGMNEDLYRGQSRFVKQLKHIAVKYNIAVILVAHPRKNNSRDFDNDDVSGSGDITNAVDVVIAYERNKDKNKDCDGLLSVTKNRLTGRLTLGNKVELYYSKSTKRITSVTTGNKVYSWTADKYGLVDISSAIDSLPF